jgi:hypothetical protein
VRSRNGHQLELSDFDVAAAVRRHLERRDRRRRRQNNRLIRRRFLQRSGPNVIKLFMSVTYGFS